MFDRSKVVSAVKVTSTEALREAPPCRRSICQSRPGVAGALTFVAAGRQVIDEHDVLSLEQYDTDPDDLVLFQLRIGSHGEEVTSWLSSCRQLLDEVRRRWATAKDAAFARMSSRMLA